MEEEISTTGLTDTEEILILTGRIGLWKSNSIPKTSRILSKFRHHTTRIFASIRTFYSIAYPSHRIFFSVRFKNGTTQSIVYLISLQPKPCNYHQFENLKRIEKKIEKNSINPIIGFDCKDMKYKTIHGLDPTVLFDSNQLGMGLKDLLNPL